jgi:hypothetical protein
VNPEFLPLAQFFLFQAEIYEMINITMITLNALFNISVRYYRRSIYLEECLKPKHLGGELKSNIEKDVRVHRFIEVHTSLMFFYYFSLMKGLGAGDGRRNVFLRLCTPRTPVTARDQSVLHGLFSLCFFVRDKEVSFDHINL